MITYQKLSGKELDTFIQMRIRQLREEGATEDIDLVPSLQDYYRRHMSDGTFVSWLALDGDRIVGTSTTGRTKAFASNFMPLMDFNTEFCFKWSLTCYKRK